VADQGGGRDANQSNAGGKLEYGSSEATGGTKFLRGGMKRKKKVTKAPGKPHPKNGGGYIVSKK